MESVFGGPSDFDLPCGNPSESSSASSTSSKENEDRACKRPCVIWKTTPTVQVLIMSRFSGVDVSDPNVRLFNHLTHEYVLNRLLAVFPKAPYGRRRSVHPLTKATNVPMETVNTNLILIPINVPKTWKPDDGREYFPVDELHYINELLHQISIEDSEKQRTFIEEINYLPPCPYNDNASNEDDNKSSSASSILPKTRTELVEDIRWKTNDFVNEWVENG